MSMDDVRNREVGAYFRLAKRPSSLLVILPRLSSQAVFLPLLEPDLGFDPDILIPLSTAIHC
jgi:hypothetical protein